MKTFLRLALFSLTSFSVTGAVAQVPYTYFCCCHFFVRKSREVTEGSEPSRINRTVEPLGIPKINGETIATASTLKNYLICLHMEEATGSIPVSPTTFVR